MTFFTIIPDMAFSESNIERLLEQAEAAGVFNKAVAGFILPDGSTRIIPFNTPEDTVFDIASLTKVCPTSTLALSYILEGKLSVDAKVIDYKSGQNRFDPKMAANGLMLQLGIYLEAALGRKVRLVEGKNRGRIELEYYGAEDREKLIENLKLFSSLRRNK